MTSGGSKIGEEVPERISVLSKAEVLPGKRFGPNAHTVKLWEWAESLKLG